MLVAALEIIINQFYFAMSDTVRPTMTGMVLLPLYAAAGYIGVVVLGWGAVAVALALLLYRAGKIIALYAMIRHKLGALEGGRVPALLGKMLLALIPFTLILLLAAWKLPAPEHVSGKIHKLLVLLPFIAAGGVGGVCYLAILHYLRTEEVSLLVARVRGKMGRKR